MSVKLAPLFNDSQIDTSTGLPLSGGKLYWYLAGTTTPVTVYQDSAGATPHTSPIVLNTRGEPPAPIWLTSGASYKAVLQDSLGNAIRTVDNITGINDTSAPTISEWVQFAGAGSYVAANQFSVTGDQTATFTVNRRVKVVQAGSTNYGTISGSAFTTVTTVTVTLDSGTLIAGSYSIHYGFQDPTHPSVADIYPAPTGTIIPFAGSSAPSGYLACPTSATAGNGVSRTTYAALFAIIGTAWGAGDGSTTFNLPWFTADQTLVQAAANVGTNTAGAVIAHTHPSGVTNSAGYAAGGGGGTIAGSGINTGSTGGAANLPAGNRVLFCVKY